MVHPFHAPERTRRRTFLTRKSLNLSGNWVWGGGGGGGKDGGIRKPVNLFPVPGRVQGDSQLLHLHGDGEDGVPTVRIVGRGIFRESSSFPLGIPPPSLDSALIR